MLTETEHKPLLITQGDPAGIGLELSLMAWLNRGRHELSPFALVADPIHVSDIVRSFKWDIPVKEATAESACDIFPNALPIIPLVSRVYTRLGHPDPASAAATLESIKLSVDLAIMGRIGGIVTNPVAKYVLLEAGYPHRRSDEFIATLAEKYTKKPIQPVLMLWSELLATVPVTTDMPLADVPLCLTSELIFSTSNTVASDLSKRFGIERPRLAITGLNPHAGENGGLGTEDRDIIAPAITLLRRHNVDARGPYSADSLFQERSRSRYDVVIAMYHDQALIPIKTLAADSSVNVTLGLPFIRVAPSHGTAFDIAGRGIGNPGNLIAALKLASHLAKTEQTAL